MQLKDIKYKDIINSKESDISKIVFLNEKEQLKISDYGVVLGGISMIPSRVDKALELYREGLIKKILLSGNSSSLNFFNLESEALKMRDYLRHHGVLESDIILETKSKTTLQNINYFLETLNFNSSSSETLTLITSEFHMKRCMLILDKILDDMKNISMALAHDNITDYNNWRESIRGKRIIYREALLLLYYAKKEILRSVEIEDLSFDRKSK